MKEILTAVRRYDSRHYPLEARIGYVMEMVPSILGLIKATLLGNEYDGRPTHRIDVTVDGVLEMHSNTPISGPFTKRRLQKAYRRADRYADMRAQRSSVYDDSRSKLTALGVVTRK